MKTFEILFVRHALSCANVWQKKGHLKAHLRYPDPEITSEGIEKSKLIGATYGDEFPVDTSTANPMYKYTPKSEPFTIGSSVMLRAQQTAYLMFAKRLNKPLFVFPYISEVVPTPDNVPAPLETQRERYQSNPTYTETPSLEDVLYKRGLNFRKQDGSLRLMVPLSSYSHFTEWIQKPENSVFFGEGSDGIYRAIIVTHSQFMQKNFKMPGIKKYNNNDGVLVRIQTGEGSVKTTPVKYFPAGQSSMDYGLCPDRACRMPPPCVGKAKNKNVKSNTTKGGKRKASHKRKTRKIRR